MRTSRSRRVVDSGPPRPPSSWRPPTHSVFELICKDLAHLSASRLDRIIPYARFRFRVDRWTGRKPLLTDRPPGPAGRRHRGVAIAGGPDGSYGPARETLPIAPTAATIDRAWSGRGRRLLPGRETPAWDVR